MFHRFFSLIFTVFISLSLFTSYAEASVVRGKKYYTQLLKEPCGFKGDVMGSHHTKNAWRAFFKSGTLNTAIKEICPKAPDIPEKYHTHLYHFLESFASDSGNVPSCN
ncbi:MAG TPA: cytochrome C [Sulfurospirillum sp. UBA12182]|jgi:hypothetical protein|nr:MAG TPA: cytochrome C [Sulfurospirillum sp. UBA12182]